MEEMKASSTGPPVQLTPLSPTPLSPTIFTSILNNSRHFNRSWNDSQTRVKDSTTKTTHFVIITIQKYKT